MSDNREPFLQNGTVDIVLASYSITDERREVVGQAGPYYVTGQQLLVRSEDDGDDHRTRRSQGQEGLLGHRLDLDRDGRPRSTTPRPVPFDTYSECVTQLQNGSVDAVTTDGAILLGYAAQAPDELKVVGEAFSEERYGIGYKHGDAAMCTFLNETLQGRSTTATWAEAFEATLGKSGVETHPSRRSSTPARSRRGTRQPRR